MLSLYYSPGACSLAPHILLREAGLPFELRLVALAEGANQKPEYLAINPKGRVPVIQDEDFVLTEVPAIFQYLTEHPGAERLVPADRHERARAWELAAWLSSTVHISYAQLWRPRRFLPKAEAEPALAASGEASIREHYRQIELQMERQAYAAGRTYSFVDPFLLVFFRWGGRIGLDMDSDYPNWRRWADIMFERPAVRDAMRTEGVTRFGLATPVRTA